jgi:RNA polymerase primary sigma factor
MQRIKITTSITVKEPMLDKYFREIDKLPLLSPDEEAELSILIQKGDKSAIDKLTKANLRFVISIAKKYQGQGLPLQDLINEGNLGLIAAAYKFDASRGFKFISYAVWYIRQQILLALADHSKVVRLPIKKVILNGKIFRSYCRLEQELERAPSANEIAEVTKYMR